MKLDSYPNLDLAYCTNCHPAENWIDTLHALEVHTLKVKQLLIEQGSLKADAPYAIGLRLSAQSAQDLTDQPELIQQFKAWLQEHNCYVFTINGFPYGEFHNTSVKEQVYRPDWSAPERLTYTKQLFKILCEIHSHSNSLSVSTLPLSFKSFNIDESFAFSQLLELSLYMEELMLNYDVDLHLGLEPEPLGHFENTQETLDFFRRFRASCPAEHQALIQKTIGLNLDTCHFALEYEDCNESLALFAKHDIRISKVHASCALKLNPNKPEALHKLKEFVEPTYLHQVLIQTLDGSIIRYSDLPAAFSAIEEDASLLRQSQEWRVHFHIPIGVASTELSCSLQSTQDFLIDICKAYQANPNLCPHLEIETYTWGVLPTELKQPIELQIRDEYQWLINELNK